MSEEKKYVLGFAFSQDGNDMVLISKLRPEWQKGKLNGIGGKIEPEDKTPLDAMIREFKEETGVSTIENSWKHFGNMTFKNDVMGGTAIVFMFKIFSDDIYECKTIEEEEIIRMAVDTALFNQPLMQNLPILIRLAKSNEFTFTEFREDF